MSDLPGCMICGGTIYGTFWVCTDCRREFPELRQPFATWPDWAKELKNMAQNERRGVMRRSYHELLMEIDTDPAAYEEYMFVERLLGGAVIHRRHKTPWPLLPFSAYADRQMDVLYRKVNGVLAMYRVNGRLSV